MAELTNFVTQIRGAKLVNSAFLIEICIFFIIKNQTWFVGKNGPGFYWGASPGPPLNFFGAEPHENYPRASSESTFEKVFSNISIMAGHFCLFLRGNNIY